MPGWHTLRLNLLVLHSLPCAENLAHTLLPRPNLPDTEVKGLHKTRQMQFGKGRTRRGSARVILMQQGWGRDGPNQPKHGWGQRDEFKPSPCPARSLCSYSQHKEQLCLGQVIFCLPSTLWLCWIPAEEGLGMLSQRGRGTHSHHTTSTALDPLCCSTAHREDSPLCSLQRALATAWFTGSGDLDGDYNVFLDLSGCQKSPHGNRARLPVRTVEDKQVFVRQLQITARLQYSKQYQEFSHRKCWNPACLTAKPCGFNRGWKTV